MNAKKIVIVFVFLGLSLLTFAQADTTGIKNTTGYKIGFWIAQFGVPLIIVGGIFLMMLHLHKKTKERERNGEL